MGNYQLHISSSHIHVITITNYNFIYILNCCHSMNIFEVQKFFPKTKIEFELTGARISYLIEVHIHMFDVCM